MTIQEILQKFRSWEQVAGFSADAKSMLRACIEEVESYAESQCESAQGDLISRQAAIQTIMDYGTDFGRRDIGFVVQCIKEAVESLPSAEPVPKWHKFRQELSPETGLWELVEPLPKDGQHILIAVAVEGHEPVQDDYWIDDVYCYLDSGYSLCTEAVAWMPMPEGYQEEPEEQEG